MENGRQAKVRMSGCLHMKVKKHMISSWKMYWFVLEDRLLLYYRSKYEYEAISPCKGSINLGPPCIVKSCPSVTNAFQIETRTNTFTLKAENTEELMKWMQAIMAALNQNQNVPTEAAKRLSHFRYSLDDLIPEREPSDCKVASRQKATFERQNTMPAKIEPTRDSNEIIQRLQKMGAHSYGGSLGAISKISAKKCGSPKKEQSQCSLPDDSRVNEEKIEPVLRPVREMGDNIYERISGDSNSSQLSNRTSFIVDNENYSVPLRKSNVKPALAFVKDTKSVLVENDQYGATPNLSSEEVIYAEPKINEVTDHNKNSVLVENSFYITNNDARNSGSTNNENVYEDLETYNHYSQLVLKNEETSSQSSQECKTKNKARTKIKDEKSKDRVKKSKSFIKRVWKKKSKKEKQESQEDEDIYEEVDKTAVEKLEHTNESTLQMLSELQNILEHKKTILRATNLNNSKDQPEDEKASEASASNSDVCPSLPPKTQKMQLPPHDIPNQPIRSLDEILEDLDKEKLESKNKVKMLIEKFSEPEPDVILRKHASFKTHRHSDELNTLLNELAKVTSAPIMTPGVTSSLINPNLTDEEWLKLLPVRQRRMSEPDYDVPRPHKSIQLPVKHENSDAIPVTRFFGPVLPPTITDNPTNKEDSLCTSMTPDSLEVEDQQKSPTHCSYTSHNYYQYKPGIEPVKNLKYFPQNYKTEDDKIIYAMPKSYLSVATHIVNTCQNICSPQLAEECTIIYKNVKNVDIQEEIFNDSLELCNESSTEF
ncbi:PH domain containing protein [Asbolus verrucosus]|uniref:PH domain containing protein n=1 Tax=Asbolus verrucosus TaxID=1661398 RepID=A0A482W577_ASBVE|nr:PH domain containing protein [Asbolus verrucosus]